MEGSDYIFCFQSKSFGFWQPDATGMITLSNKPYFFNYAPVGWETIEISAVRNKKYWGIDRSVSTSLSFVNDASQILKHIVYTLGVEEEVYLVIARQQLEYVPGVSYGYWYKQIHRAEVDLTDFVHDGARVTCRTLEDGLPKYLKANENTINEFPMNVPEAINVKMDGIKLHEKLNFVVPDGINYVNVRYIPAFSFIGSDGNSVGVSFLSESYEAINGTAGADTAYVTNSDNYFLKNMGTSPLLINIKGNLIVRSDLNSTLPPSGSSLRVKTDKPTGLGGTTEYILFSSTPAINTTYNFPVNINITVNPGEKLFMYGRTSSVNDVLYHFTYLPGSNLSVSFVSRQATTYIKAFRAQYLFTQLINKITEGNLQAAIANYFIVHAQKVFTCGNALRGLPDAVMKMSFSDFFQDFDSYDAVGISKHKNIVNFDTKGNLIDRVNIITLPAPAEGSFKVSIAKEWLFNELEIGYPEIKNEIGVLNGNEEFNCKFLFSIGTTKSPAKVDKVSKIQAGCYPIELIRVTTLSKDTTDNKADNDLFSLYVEPNSTPGDGLAIPNHYKLDRSLNSTATGLVEPLTVFNIPLSPKRNFLRNGAFFNSCMYLANNKVFAYKSSDKNNKLVANGVVEKEDVPVSSLANKFFYPLVMEGVFPAPDQLISLLDLKPNQLFEFPVDGTMYKGIMVKVSIAPSSRQEQQYQFYCDPSNNIQKLMQYYGG